MRSPSCHRSAGDSMIELTDQPFDPSTLLRSFTDEACGSGAVVSFTGLVRNHAENDEVVELYLEAYSPLTETGISEIVSQALARWEVDKCLIVHRIGHMKPGEAIVFVATASSHRREAFEATDFIMDYLKTEAVFWKKETTSNGTKWIEPRSADYADAERWRPSRAERCNVHS